VNAVTFADESQVVGGYANSEIRRWNIEDGRQQGSTMKANGAINCILVSQDGQWMVSGDRGKKVIVWNAVTHEQVREFTENVADITGIDISSDCTKFVSADLKNVKLFSITSGERLHAPLPHDRVASVKFSPDSSRLATASESYGFRVYSTHDGNILFDSGRNGSTGSWSRTPSNGRFIACAAGSSVSLWDCVSHKQIKSLITHTSQVTCVALSPSGRYLACGHGRNITIHNLRNVLPPEYFNGGVRVHSLIELELYR
ncbi:hypothetical protein M404DRAFT_138824, partial [Pisolithus tinctorius Marx 270]